MMPYECGLGQKNDVKFQLVKKKRLHIKKNKIDKFIPN